ncbi:unnamed protein product, partial [Hapterophycus canaliculatus]
LPPSHGPSFCFAGVSSARARAPLVCRRCKVLVHQHCYGCREEPEEGTPWLCDVCE